MAIMWQASEICLHLPFVPARLAPEPVTHRFQHVDTGQWIVAEDQDWKVTTGKLVKTSLLGLDVVDFTDHALQRMKQRRIKEYEILGAIRNPDATGLPTDKDRERVRKNRNLYEAIDVVYEVGTKRVRIITTFVVKISDRPSGKRSGRKRRKKR